MPDKKPKYRLNVAAILQDPSGRILICERLGQSGAWQFPQGGVDKGESLMEALIREIEEEIGITSDQWEHLHNDGPFRYTFGKGRKVKGYDGKDQHFFLVRFHGDPNDIRVDLPNPEFQDYKWIRPDEFQLTWIPEMKREMYQLALASLLGLKLV